MSAVLSRLHDWHLIWRFAGLGILGALAGLGQAPWGLWWMTVAALAVLVLTFSSAPSPRRAFGVGWAFGFGYFGLTLHWIVEPFLVDAASTGWMAPFALLLMASGAALFWGLAAWGARRIGVGKLGFAVALTLVEAARSLVLTGFPWALLGHIWIDTPLAQLAAFVGPHGLTLMTALLAWALVAVMRSPWPGLVPLFAVTGWFALNPGPAPTPEGPIVRLVQPNVPQNEKWDPERRQFYFDRMLRMTSDGTPPDLIVWPETAIPTLMTYAQAQLDLVTEAARGTPLITGINRSNGLRYYNSFILLGQGGTVSRIYDKAHLAPFGEYIPFGEWLGRFGVHGLAASGGGGFSAGGVQPLVEIPGIGAARALICYEGIFAEEIGHKDRPRLMVLITNDAWFGTAAGPYQHLAQARLRAIEQGVPMVRVANTGISAMIDGRGRITAHIPLGEAAAQDVTLPPAAPETIYAISGDYPALMLSLLSLLGLTWRNWRFS